MQNMYDLVKNGRTLKEINSAADLLNLVVMNFNSDNVGITIEEAYENISSALGRDTDNDFDERYFLITVSEIDGYFNSMKHEIKHEMDVADSKHLTARNNAFIQIKKRRSNE